MSDGEDDRVREVHLVGVFVYGCCDNRRVDDYGVIGSQCLAAQLHAGVLRGEVNPDVFVEDKCDPNLTCRKNNLMTVWLNFCETRSNFSHVYA